MSMTALVLEFSTLFIVLLLATLPAAVHRFQRR
ncbi:hypothetical protein HNR62_002589 [Oceanisphaera litoralis]|nr:hypothetical protein [Oceanisphaera litoralis]